MKVEKLPYAALRTHFKPLTLAYLTEFDRLRACYAVDWRDEKALLERARKVTPIERETADAVEMHLAALGAPASSLAALAKLRHGAACVVTGQQPGLLGGPLYNLYKAITAVRLARHIDDRGVPCVAVFWNHADDHNPADLGRLALPDGCLDVPLEDDGRPVGERAISTDTVGAFQALLPVTPHRRAVDASLLAASSRRLGETFARALLQWLGAQGLVVLEPGHLGPRAAAVLERARREPDLVERAAASATQRLRALGFEPPIAGDIGASLFVVRDGRRRRLERSGTALYLDGAAYDGGGRLSPAVALRPVVQDAALPTAAYVGGPNELAYFAQLGDVYRAFDVPMPAIFPRASATIIEPRVQRVIEKFALKGEELFLGREALAARVSARAQQGLLDDVSRVDLAMRERLRGLEGALGVVDKSLIDASRKTAEKASRLFSAFRDRIVESQRQADQVSGAQIDKLCSHVLPGGAMQERKFTPWYYAAMLGPSFVTDLVEALDPFAAAHALIRPE